MVQKKSALSHARMCWRARIRYSDFALFAFTTFTQGLTLSTVLL